MISITCTKCHATLEMDEAFAGGVCRCQYCGTIQTVPSNLKQTAGAAKSLYSNPANGNGGGGGAAASSGLDDLASAVSSSGLSGSGLRAQGQRAGTSRAAGLDYRKPTPANAGKPMVLIGAGVVILVLLGVIAALFWSKRSPAPVVRNPGGSSSPGSTATVGGSSAPGGATGGSTGGGTNAIPQPPPVTGGPNFVGLGLAGGTKVVYVIDRGNSTERFFDSLKYAISRSVESLGAGNQFAVVFWRNTGGEAQPLAELSFPAAGLASATSEQASAFLKKAEDITASGSTSIDDAIREAVARKPTTIVIASAKDDLGLDGVAAAVDKARGSAGIKVYAVSLGDGGNSNVLKQIAAKAGGQYFHVDSQTLKDQ